MHYKRILAIVALLQSGMLATVIAYYCRPLGIFLLFSLIPFYIGLRSLTFSCAHSANCFGLGVIFCVGYLFGLSYFIATFFWLFKIHPGVGTFAVCFHAAYMGFLFLSVALFTRKYPQLPLWCIVPGAWTVWEFIRGNFLFAFPAGSMGYGLIEYPVLIQGAQLFGVYGISYIVVLTNALCAEYLLSRKKEYLFGICLLLAFVAGCGYLGMKRPLQNDGSVRLAILQGNLAREVHENFSQRGRLTAVYSALFATARRDNPELIIFPEGTIVGDLLDPRGSEILAFFRENARAAKTHLLAGAGRLDQASGQARAYNSAYLFTPSGEVRGVYDKRTLVPFFESVPFLEKLPLLKMFHLGETIYSPGAIDTVFHAPWGRFSALICFEALFPLKVKRFIDGGAQLLVNISNDFDLMGSKLVMDLNDAMVMFRAVEYRRYVVKCNRLGNGLIVTPHGISLGKLPYGRPGHLGASVGLCSEKTFYARYPDIFPRGMLCFALLAFCIPPKHVHNCLRWLTRGRLL